MFWIVGARQVRGICPCAEPLEPCCAFPLPRCLAIAYRGIVTVNFSADILPGCLTDESMLLEPTPMKIFFLMLAAVTFSASAHAEWARVEHSASDFALYIDKETLQPSGTGTMVLWHLQDYTNAQDYDGKPYLSIKGQVEYDCEKGIKRSQMHLRHQDGMGNSHLVHAAYKPGPWGPVVEGSHEQTLMRIVCKDR